MSRSGAVKILSILASLFRFDRPNWTAAGLCVLASVVFWIFNSLNKPYSTNIKFPLLFEFDGEKYAVAGPLPKSINLNVSGTGWDLFRKRFGLKVPPILVPLEHPNEIQKIVGSTLEPLLAGQVGSLKINFVVTDTLHLAIDKKDSHRYKLVADISNLNFREGYGRTSRVVVLPDSVRVEGPERILHALPDSLILKVNGQDVAEDFRDEDEIIFLGSELVKREPAIAQIMFEVAEVKTVEVKLKVKADNPSALSYDSITAVFQVPTAHFSDFKEQSKGIYTQVNSKFYTHSRKVLPRLVNIPAYAHPLRIDSVLLRAN